MAPESGKTKSKKVAWAPGLVFESGLTLPAPQSPNPFKRPTLHGLWRGPEDSHQAGRTLEIAEDPLQVSSYYFGRDNVRGTRSREPLHVEGWSKPIYEIEIVAFASIDTPDSPKIVRDRAYYERIHRERWIPRQEGRDNRAMTPEQEDHLIEVMESMGYGRSRRRGNRATREGQVGGSGQGPSSSSNGLVASSYDQADVLAHPEPAKASGSLEQTDLPDQQRQSAVKTEPPNLTPWLSYDFKQKGRNLLMTLPGELRNRIYNMVFVKGDIRIKHLSRAQSSLTYELQQQHGKWEAPFEYTRETKKEIVAERKARNHSWHHRVKQADPSPCYQAGGIAALMVCCKSIYLETAPLFYSNFTWTFSNARSMKTFVDRMSSHAVSGIHTVSLEHATYGIPYETNFYGYKKLQDEYFLRLCNHTAQALVNLRSFNICVHINQLAPLELSLSAPWVMPVLAFAHRNLQRARVKFLAANGYGHNDEKLKAFATVVKRELVGYWLTSRQVKKVLDDVLRSTSTKVVIEKVHTTPAKDKRVEGARARYDSDGYIVGDDKPHRLRRIIPSLDDDDSDGYFLHHGPPLRNAGMEYTFTSPLPPRLAESYQG